MPLCTFEIPRNQFESLPTKNRNGTVIDLCNNSLKLTLQGLGIPDPNDREFRMIITEPNGDSKPRISISFTSGSDEYKTGTIFDPTEKQIHDTGVAIQSQAQNSAFNKPEVRMESWKDTTFLIRDPKATEPIPPLGEQGWINQANDTVQPVVRLMLSPNALKSFSFGPENEPFKELRGFQNIAREISGLVAENLKLPNTEQHVEVLLSHLAETDIAVDVDFPNISEKLSPDVRLHLAKTVERLLNLREPTKEGNATIWIRQGQPTVDIIPIPRDQ